MQNQKNRLQAHISSEDDLRLFEEGLKRSLAVANLPLKTEKVSWINRKAQSISGRSEFGMTTRSRR